MTESKLIHVLSLLTHLKHNLYQSGAVIVIDVQLSPSIVSIVREQHGAYDLLYSNC
jgi:hypothetical protein